MRSISSRNGPDRAVYRNQSTGTDETDISRERGKRMDKLINMYVYLTTVFVVMCIIGGIASIWVNKRIGGDDSDE